MTGVSFSHLWEKCESGGEEALVYLTSADTVIIYDPWWNPAVELQAADRTHRIGQTRAVSSVKLVVKDSIEEKILELQEQ